MTAARRIVMLGIDGANPALMRQWAGDGTLPNLAALMARGLCGPTENLPGFFIGSTWPSFYTGASPARHGFHYQVQLRPGTYDLYRPEKERLVRIPAFWHYLSQAGKRVAILDVPLTQLESQINGVQTVEWGGHDAVYGFQATPPELASMIRKRFGDHPAGPTCDGIRKSAADYERFAARLVRGVQKKTELTRYLLGQERWDFFAQVFTETHCAGHQCWHLHDQRHPAHDPALAARMADPLRTVYAAVDHAIGEIVRESGDALVVVLSTHGMSSFYGAQFMLREILGKLGVTESLPPQTASDANEGGFASTARALWHRLPPVLRASLKPLRDSLARPHAEPESEPDLNIDPARSRCFPLSNGLGVGGIRLNLAGREPQGTIHAGAEADAFIARLSADLLDIVDERSSGPLVRRVLRTRELYAGPYLDALPDLLVEWNDAVATGSSCVAGGRGARVSAHSAKIGRMEQVNSYGRTGEHRPEGMFIAAGPQVRTGAMAHPVSILDFAPTFCEFLGVALPICDGTPLTELRFPF
jgi:predicted AlkP superfamily phosphohydrolase/phosphomutase